MADEAVLARENPPTAREPFKLKKFNKVTGKVGAFHENPSKTYKPIKWR